MSDEKPSLRIYISFLKEDGESAIPCVRLLKRTIKAGLKDRYNALFFHPDDVSVGEVIDETLNRRVSELEIAIVLVSNEYLFEEREADRVRAKHPHPIIVKLENIGPGASFKPFDRRDIVPGQSFSQAQDAGRTAEQDFANSVLGMIERELTNRQAYAHTSEPRLTPDEIAEELSAHARLQLTAEAVPARAKRGLFEQTQGRNDEDGIGPEPFADITDVVKHLVTWACESTGDSSRLCALLGDLGTGKTTSAILLTRKLLERRKSGEQVPLPFYFDLRDLSPTGLADLGLRTVLTHLLSVSTKLAVMVDDVLDAIRSEPTMVVFDGLDETLVHLSPDDGDRLTQSLLEVLTLNVPDSGAKPPGTHLLLSCRTQYFRTMNDEVFFVNGEESERTHGKDYLLLTMLPFDEKQIREYLRRNVPRSNPDQILEMIRSVHDLRALAAQPVMLNMIRKVLPTIEEDRRAGRRVRSVDLYERFVDRWLRRDKRKHSLIPEHKIKLMTHLAWQVWNSGNRTWSASWMETWMIQFLHTHPDMELHYERRTPNQWKQDFRTATFLARRGDSFAFAHSSLLEYFLAKRLADSLLADPEDGALATWDITRPNDETYAFLAELINRLPTAERTHALFCFERVGKYGSITARTNIFAYTLQALERHYLHPRPRALNLSDTDLRDWKIGSEQTHVDLSGAPLTGARLDDAHIQHTRLDRADAAKASMQRALFEHCSLTNADLKEADLAGTIFRHCDLEGASLDKARRHRTQLLHSIRDHQPQDILTAPLSESSIDTALTPTIQLFRGHINAVGTVAWSPDGAYILTGSDDCTARVWDARTGENTLIFVHTAPVTAVAWSPDSMCILTASGDGIARIWNATTGNTVFSLNHTAPVTAVAWSPDSTCILTASCDATVHTWDTRSGERILTLTLNGWITAVAWSPDSTCILTASDDATTHIWNAATGKKTLTLIQAARVRAVAWSPDGARIFTGSSDRTARIWNARTGENTLTLKHTAPVTTVAWSPDATRILTGSSDRTARIWNAKTGENTLTLTHDRAVSAVTWSPDATRVLTASNDHAARIHNAVSGEPTLTLVHTDRVRAVSWSPDSIQILTAFNDRTARVWNTRICKNTFTLVHADRVRAVSWSPDGIHALTGSDDHTARIWNARTGENTLTLTHSAPVTTVSWSPDATRILTTSGDGATFVWDAITGNTTFTYSGRVRAAAWSPDSTHILTGSDDHTARMRDARTGQKILTLTHDDWVTVVSWSPEGTHILTGSWDGTARIWDINTGENTLTLSHECVVSAVAWSPDSTHILTGSQDGTARIWDATTGEQVRFFITALPGGECAVLTPDQTRVIGASPYAWRWLGRYAVHPDGTLERIPVEIDGPLPPLGPGAQAE